MKLRFKGVPVEIINGDVICEDDLVADMLEPIVQGATGGPEDGDPYLNAITDVFGVDSVTDVEIGNNDDKVIN